jgi:AcrR family transcriptional regulator
MTTAPTVEAILDATERLLEAGGRAPTVREIAAAAGLSAGALYAHFPGRDDVLTAALARHAAREAALDAAALQAPGAADALARLVAGRVARTRDRPGLALAALALPPRHRRAPAVRAAAAAAAARLADALARHPDATGPLGPARSARLAAAALEGVALGALEERPQYLDDPAFVAAATALVAALALRDPPAAPAARARSNAQRYRADGPTVGVDHRPPRQSRSRALVDAVLLAAQRVVEREHVDRATTTRVARVAGVSVGSLYRYFGDRASLLGALSDRRLRVDLGLVEAAVAEAAAGARPLADAAADGVLRLHALHARHRALYAALFRLLPELDRWGPALDAIARSRGAMVARLAAHPDAAAVDLDLACFVLGHAWSGWTRALTLDDPDLLDSEAFADAVRRGCRALLRPPA